MILIPDGFYVVVYSLWVFGQGQRFFGYGGLGDAFVALGADSLGYRSRTRFGALRLLHPSGIQA